MSAVWFVTLIQLNEETSEEPFLCCFILKNLSNSLRFLKIVMSRIITILEVKLVTLVYLKCIYS
jgi:hypothetical protein